MNAPAPNHATKPLLLVKRGALITLVVTFIALGVLGAILGREALDAASWGHALTRWLAAVAVIGCSFVWCLIDSEENDHPFGRYLPIVFLAALPVALLIYLYRSRGFAGGSLAAAKAIGFGVVVFALATVSYVATSFILQAAP